MKNSRFFSKTLDPNAKMHCQQNLSDTACHSRHRSVNFIKINWQLSLRFGANCNPILSPNGRILKYNPESTKDSGSPPKHNHFLLGRPTPPQNFPQNPFIIPVIHVDQLTKIDWKKQISPYGINAEKQSRIHKDLQLPTKYNHFLPFIKGKPDAIKMTGPKIDNRPTRSW